MSQQNDKESIRQSVETIKQTSQEMTLLFLPKIKQKFYDKVK